MKEQKYITVKLTLGQAHALKNIADSCLIQISDTLKAKLAAISDRARLIQIAQAEPATPIADEGKVTSQTGAEARRSGESWGAAARRLAQGSPSRAAEAAGCRVSDLPEKRAANPLAADEARGAIIPPAGGLNSADTGMNLRVGAWSVCQNCGFEVGSTRIPERVSMPATTRQGHPDDAEPAEYKTECPECGAIDSFEQLPDGSQGEL